MYMNEKEQGVEFIMEDRKAMSLVATTQSSVGGGGTCRLVELSSSAKPLASNYLSPRACSRIILSALQKFLDILMLYEPCLDNS